MIEKGGGGGGMMHILNGNSLQALSVISKSLQSHYSHKKS
jgi:hypothetical protein